MRIQPHVWKSNPNDSRSFLSSVLRDALVTHGHPQGFCGAVFHALCVGYALYGRAVPGPSEWKLLLLEAKDIPEIVSSDDQLRTFWLGSWERETGRSLKSAVDEHIDAAIAMLPTLPIRSSEPPSIVYSEVLTAIGGLDEGTRGAGTISAIAAVILSWLYREAPHQEALLASANALGSDTDTIGSMAGAILGAARTQELEWTVQDRPYIQFQAHRMATIAAGGHVKSYAYPDLLNWVPPGSQSDIVGLGNGGLAVAGLGYAESRGEVWSVGEFEWQWLQLQFGQTIFAKRRRQLRQIQDSQLPPLGTSSWPDLRGARTHPEERFAQAVFPPEVTEPNTTRVVQQSNPAATLEGKPPIDLDRLTDRVIGGDFAPELLRQAFLESIDGDRPLESAVAFASIIAKAVVTRRRRRASVPS